MALAMSSKSETGIDVIRLKLGELLKKLLAAHSSRKILKNIAHCNPHSPDTRLPAPLPRLNRDSLTHGLKLADFFGNGSLSSSLTHAEIPTPHGKCEQQRNFRNFPQYSQKPLLKLWS